MEFDAAKEALKKGYMALGFEIKLYPKTKPTSEPNSFHSMNTLLLFLKTFFDALNCLHHLVRFLASPLFPILS